MRPSQGLARDRALNDASATPQERCSPLDSPLLPVGIGRGSGVMPFGPPPLVAQNPCPQGASLAAHPRRQGHAASRCAEGAGLTACGGRRS